MVTIGATNSGKALMKIATFQIISDYMVNYRSEESIFAGEEVVVAILEVIKVIIE